MLINPNGIAITPGAVINTNSFTASSLDIKNEDFLKDKYIFEGKGNSKGVVNKGSINVNGGGHAALLGGLVSNTGIVTAKLGKIFLGSGEKITVDFVGDGLMKVTIPISKLGNIKDIKGRTLKSIVSNKGTLKANGGIIQLSAADAQYLSRGTVNLSQSGKIYARNVGNKSGRIVIGGPNNQSINLAGTLDASSRHQIQAQNKNSVVAISGGDIKLKGNIYAKNHKTKSVNIKARGNLELNNKIIASGNKFGGEIMLNSGNSTIKSPSSYLDVSGGFKGGRITSSSKMTNESSGGLNASSASGYGGVIDIVGSKISVKKARINAQGKKHGAIL